MKDPSVSIDDDELAGDCETIDVLASDFLARYRDGERPTIEGYVRRHPEFADSIRRMFPLVASIEQIKIGDQVAGDGSATLAGRSPTALGDFRIIREIGRGGMGVVFEAHQESLDRRVAVKVLPRQWLLDDESLERFRREATMAASMHHSHIVPVFGSGEDDGAHYLVMQLIEGTSLDERISAGPEISFQEAARIGCQIADAVAYAHANGVLHRDIKPANVLIEAEGTVQITDFGLAKGIGTEKTRTAAVSGSLRYMAPERFSGISDERSDVYGIGLTIYEMLAGRPAFEASDTEHLIGSITAPKLRPIVSVRPGVPIDLETIVHKSIQVDRNVRYSSAAELHDDLARLMANEPIRARRTSLAGRLNRWVRRNPKLALASGTATTAMLAATIVSTVAYTTTSAANRRTADALGQSEQTVDLALQSLDDVVDIVSQSTVANQLSVGEIADEGTLLPDVAMQPSQESARILESLQRVYQQLSKQAPTRPDIVLRRIDAGIQLARIKHTLGQTADGIAILEACIASLDQPQPLISIPEDDRQLRLARLHNEVGDMQVADFRRGDASGSYDRSIQAALSADTSKVAVQIELARGHLNRGNRPHPLRRSESQTDQSRAVELEHVDVAIGLLDDLDESGTPLRATRILRARALLARARFRPGTDRGHTDFSAGITILRDQLAISPDDDAVRFELVSALADVNVRGLNSSVRHDEAIGRLQTALDELGSLRAGSPENAVYRVGEIHLRHKLSAIARTRSQFEEASDLLGEAIRLQSGLLDTWPDSVRHRCWRAMLYRSQAQMYLDWIRPAEAERSVAKARADLKLVDPRYANHPLVIRTQKAIRNLDDAN